MAALSDVMTTADAADVLGVSPRQIRRLVAIGDLLEAARLGGTTLVDARSVHRLAARGSQRGRPWSENVAWAVIDLLGTASTDRVTAAQRSRLRGRLRNLGAVELARFARGRADTRRYRAAGSLLKQLAEVVVLTGAAAVATDRSIADEFELASGGADVVDGYVERRQMDRIVEHYFLMPDPAGNVILRATDHVPQAGGRAPTAAVAIDLVDSLDTRQHAAGLSVLDRLMRGV